MLLHPSKATWSRPWLVFGAAVVLYAGVFLARATEIVDTEAADTLLAAPIALIAIAFGASGGIAAGLFGAAVFAGAEAVDTADLTWEEVVVRGVGFSLMVATMLHSIATGNLLPAWVKVACVDINPSTVTKLTDRGSIQTVGVVTDAEPFLRALVYELDQKS